MSKMMSIYLVVLLDKLNMGKWHGETVYGDYSKYPSRPLTPKRASS